MPPVSKLNVISGQTFGRLTSIRALENYKWLFICQCGKEHQANIYRVISGGILSCGCLRRERCGNTHRTHGKSKTSEYNIWIGLRDRCLNPNNNTYEYYGGRGISVCSRWLSSFENFYEDMGPKPSKKHSIDRIDPDCNYEPSNCRWSTPIEQMNNRRPSDKYGHPYTASLKAPMVRDLFSKGFSRTEIARQLSIGRTTVSRILRDERP